MKKMLVVCMAAFIACLAAASSYAFTVPTLTGRVNDYAGLLSKSERSMLEEKSRALETKTTAQVVILTVPDTGGADIASFSMKVAEAWKIGQKGKDNGVLITYAAKGDHYRIDVGYGLEGAIPDGKAGDILRNQLRAHANPKKGTHDFAGGFSAALDEIANLITAEHAKDAGGGSSKKSDLSPLLLFAGAGIVLLIAAAIGIISGMVTGAALGWLGATLLGSSALVLILGILCGLVVGLIASLVIRALVSGGGFGGGYGDGFSSFSSGSSSDFGGGSGGFDGGGGGFGGGGASD